MLRRELATNMGALVAADEVSHLKEWILALQKVEDGLGEHQSTDMDFPLDKIAKMLNEAS